MRNSRPQCWNMRWTRKRCVNKWRRGEREKRKGSFFPQSLIIKLIKSSKVTKKERKKKGVTSSRFEIWYGQKPREKKKERKTRLKKKKRERERKRKGREREKEREEKLFSPIVKIRKDEKKGKEKNSSKREEERGWKKSKVRKKKSERKGERTVKWIAFFFSMVFLFIPFLLLRGRCHVIAHGDEEVGMILSSRVAISAF